MRNKKPSQYYYAKDSKKKGPYSFAQLQKKNLKDYTPVWEESKCEWCDAGDIEGLVSEKEKGTSPFYIWVIIFVVLLLLILSTVINKVFIN
ncbi:MAG: DUF4339 domain-containing protein [Bacteroidota bacterium]